MGHFETGEAGTTVRLNEKKRKACLFKTRSYAYFGGVETQK